MRGPFPQKRCGGNQTQRPRSGPAAPSLPSKVLCNYNWVWWMMREKSICCSPSFHAAYSQSYCILQRLPKCWTTSKRTRRPLTISSVLSCPSWQLDQLSVRFHGWRHHLPTCGRHKPKQKKIHSIHANTARRVYYTIINMLTILNKIIVRAPPPPPL